MSILSAVTTKNIVRPPRVVVHGCGGVGKTTFGIQACKQNNGIFIQIEDGLDSLGANNIARFPRITKWGRTSESEDTTGQFVFYDALKSLVSENHDYKTVVIDTIDSGVPMLDEFVVETYYNGDAKKADAYKNKYGDYVREMSKVLKAMDILSSKGIMPIVLSHSVVENHKDPSTESYKRWEMHLPGGDKTSLGDMLYNWADIVLFATFDVVVDTNRHGTGGNRVAYTEWSPAYDAKNRYGLPNKIQFDYNTMMSFVNKSIEPTKDTNTNKVEAK